MKTEQKEDKIIHKFRLKKNDTGSFVFDHANFDTSPDSDGMELNALFERIKEKEIITVTIELKKTTPEYLSCSGKWVTSGNLQEDIDNYKRIGQDNEYMYSISLDLLYRTKLVE